MKTIEQIKTDRSTFSIGQAFSDGWNLVSKNLGYYILGGVVALIIGGAAGIVPYVGDIAANLILSPCLMAGAVYVTWRISKGEGWTDFGDMFKGFKFLQPVAFATLIQFTAYLLIGGLFLLSNINELIKLYELSQGINAFDNREEMKTILLQLFNPTFILLFILMMIAFLFIGITWAFKNHFIVIYNMQAWPALDMSRRIASHNLFSMIGFFLLMGIIIIISAIPCGIGLLFTLPLMIGATYSAFAQITNCDEADEINEEMFDFMGDGKVE